MRRSGPQNTELRKMKSQNTHFGANGVAANVTSNLVATLKTERFTWVELNQKNWTFVMLAHRFRLCVESAGSKAPKQIRYTLPLDTVNLGKDKIADGESRRCQSHTTLMQNGGQRRSKFSHINTNLPPLLVGRCFATSGPRVH